MLCSSHLFTPPRPLKIYRQSSSAACTNRSSQTWSWRPFTPQICLRCALGGNKIAGTNRGMAHISSSIVTKMVYISFFSIPSTSTLATDNMNSNAALVSCLGHNMKMRMNGGGCYFQFLSNDLKFFYFFIFHMITFCFSSFLLPYFASPF